MAHPEGMCRVRGMRPKALPSPLSGRHRDRRRAPAWLPLLRRPRRRGCAARIALWVALGLAVSNTATALLTVAPLVAAVSAIAGAIVGAVAGVAVMSR